MCSLGSTSAESSCFFLKEQRDEIIEFWKKLQGNNDSAESIKKATFNEYDEDSINVLSLIQ